MQWWTIPATRDARYSNLVTFAETTLFWSPIDIGDIHILGTFIDIGFDREITSHLGFKFSWFKILLDEVFQSQVVYKYFDIEVGYSIFDHNSYIAIKTDLSFALNRLVTTREYYENNKESK